MSRLREFLAIGLAMANTELITTPVYSEPASSPVIHTLVEGAALRATQGIIFDDNDVLHIASFEARQIIVMDPETGEVLDTLGPEIGVDVPDDLIFGPDGSLYWTSFSFGDVGRLAPDGTVTTQFIAPGVNPITFSDDGRLFTAQCFAGETVFELSPELDRPPREIISFPGTSCGLNGMDWGPDGRLYGPRQFVGDVVAIDVDNGTFEVVADGFGGPGAVKFDHQGRLHVLDPFNGEIVRVDVESGEHTTIARLTKGLDNLAFTSDDRLFISSFSDKFIVELVREDDCATQQVHLAHEPEHALGEAPCGEFRTVSPGGLGLTSGIAVVSEPGRRETIFVVDAYTLRQFKARSGREQNVTRWVPGLPPALPLTVAPDDGNLVLSSWASGLVQVWDPDAQEVIEEHAFDAPINAIRFQGDLIVAEFGSGSVIRVPASDPAARQVLVDGLAVPAGLAASQDEVWVSDQGDGKVWKIIEDGISLASPVLVADDLEGPEGLALDGQGDLLVVEAKAGRIARIDPETGATFTVAEDLAIGAEGPSVLPPTWAFNGIAVGRGGWIYATSDIEGSVYRIRPRRGHGYYSARQP
jgi:sugar lactone lactonase YvrE